MSEYKVLYIDLDETLYPKTNGIWQTISRRINQFLVDRLNISPEIAQELRQQYLDSYGTTLNGLLHNHDIDPMDYLDFVHEIPIESMLQPDPALRQVLEKTVPRKFIFTNASAEHANRVLKYLNLQDLFEGIIDIIALEFHNKPLKESYQRALSLSGDPEPADCMIIDDRIANLIPAKDWGMTTVLVGNDKTAAVDHCIPSIHEILQLVPSMD